MGKLLSYFLVSLVISLFTVFLTYLASQLILLINNMPTVSIFDSTLRQFVIGIMIMPVFYTLLTAAAVFIFKGSGGAITFSLLVLAVPALIKMFSANVQRLLLPIFPQSAIHSIAGVVEKGSFEVMGIFLAILVLLAWILITSLIALYKFQKRDI